MKYAAVFDALRCEMEVRNMKRFTDKNGVKPFEQVFPEKLVPDDAPLNTTCYTTAENLHRYFCYTSWRSFDEYVKTFSEKHPEFKNLWKTFFKRYFWRASQTKYYDEEEKKVKVKSVEGDVTLDTLYNFVLLDAYALLFNLLFDREELERMKNVLFNGGIYTFPSFKEFPENINWSEKIKE